MDESIQPIKLGHKRKLSTNSSTFSSHEPIDMNLLLSISNINTLISLYLCQKYRFSKLLNNRYVLNQIAINFYITGIFDNFIEFQKTYKLYLRGKPPKFGSGKLIEKGCFVNVMSNIRHYMLPNDLQWNSLSREIWFGKFITISKSNKIKRIDDIDNDYNTVYEALDKSMIWDEFLSLSISLDIYTPEEKLFVFINHSYTEYIKDIGHYDLF